MNIFLIPSTFLKWCRQSRYYASIDWRGYSLLAIPIFRLHTTMESVFPRKMTFANQEKQKAPPLLKVVPL